MREILSKIIDPAIEKLLTYTTTESKVNIPYSEYFSSPNRKLYGMAKDQNFIGCIGIELKSAGIGEIMHIAVSPSERGKKTASKMIEFVCRENSLQTITAETDQDAVGFYKAYGFEVTSLGKKYPGVERFHCIYRLKVIKTSNQLLKDITKWVKTADKQITIGISGHGAAGKTTFATQLINMIGENHINYLNTDPYIISSDVRKQTIINYEYNKELHRYKMTACHPAAHHLPSLQRDVQMIKDGLAIKTIETHYGKSDILSAKNNITIVEGMSAAFIDTGLYDLSIYFYTDGATELKRRSGRDVLERGTDINYLKKSHEERRIQYGIYMHPYSEKFDIVIKTTNNQMSIEKANFDFKQLE